MNYVQNYVPLFLRIACLEKWGCHKILMIVTENVVILIIIFKLQLTIKAAELGSNKKNNKIEIGCFLSLATLIDLWGVFKILSILSAAKQYQSPFIRGGL